MIPAFSDAPVARRIGPLARLPILVGLRGASCLVVGGGEIGQWKAEVLAAAGADVLLVDPKGQPQGDRPQGVTFASRPFSALDAVGKKLVVAATADAETNRAVAEAGRRNGALVNVVDAGEVSDFIFPAIVNRSPVIVAISTEGAAPMLARMLRRRIESLLPAALAAIAGFARKKRRDLARIIPEPATRRRLWEDFFERAVTEGIAAQEHLERQLRTSIDVAMAPGGGGDLRIALVEAPADPDDLTVRSLRLLNAADVIVIDEQVPPSIADHARREARRISVKGRPTTQHSAWTTAIEAARRAAASRSQVVWLCLGGCAAADRDWLRAKLAAEGMKLVHLPCVPQASTGPSSPAR